MLDRWAATAWMLLATNIVAFADTTTSFADTNAGGGRSFCRFRVQP
ncbi:MAG: hypothetical protein NT154_41640 [Verrucomicrobia bacterium]|nr:hypothetical protein [Verrucomicrobiota bacterium]